MKHAVLLTVHNNTTIVKTLIKLLDDSRFSFYLLKDSKSDIDVEKFVPELKNASITLLEPQKMYWAGFSLIDAEFKLIERAVKDSPDFLHYLNGADLPLKTADEIDAFFEENRSDIFIDTGDKPDLFSDYKVYCKHYFVENSLFRTNKAVKILNHAIAKLHTPFVSEKSKKYPLYAGSALWSIPGYFAEYVLSKKDAVYKIYKNSLAADEVFIQSLLMNSEYAALRSTHKNARYIDWKNREGNSPKTFKESDWEEIKSAIYNPNLIFARKFSEDVDLKIVDLLNSELKNK